VTDRCAIPGCGGEVEIIYLDRGLCDKHWNELIADDASRTRLRMGLGLDTTTSPALEADMSETETTAAEGAAEETTVAKKTKGTKKAKLAKTAKPKAVKAKASKPKREKVESGPEPTRVFAVRVTDQELAALHRTAGPRNASRFGRAVLAAFAGEDEAAFRSVLKEAREARG
jgi:hypothetical protein